MLPLHHFCHLSSSSPPLLLGHAPRGFRSVLSDVNSCTVGNANLRNNRFRAPEAVVAVRTRLKKQFQESPDEMQNQEDVLRDLGGAGFSGRRASGEALTICARQSYFKRQLGTCRRGREVLRHERACGTDVSPQL